MGYETIAGERRWRAAQEAGLKNVPIIIRNASDIEAAELSLIENLQREELNPLEEASAYNTLVEIFGQTHETIAAKIGKDRSKQVADREAYQYDLEKQLSNVLMTRVQIKKRIKNGSIEIRFSSTEELGRIVELLFTIHAD